MTTRALLLTDLVDSTRLVERLGDERAAEVFAAHDRATRALLGRHRGREIDRTDGFFVLFEHTAEAAAFALAYHEALVELALTARVGIHFGPVALRDNAPADIAIGAKPVEVEGLAKPLAARVMALATGGQTLLSAAARDALGDALPHQADLESHGFYRLKGIEDPIELFELGTRTGAAFAPPADIDKAYRVVRDGDFWRPVREVRHNLPAERDAFVGRSAELGALAARLDAGSRLVTVLGPGGTGKTRFVRRYGWTWLGDWPGGVYFADLSEARSVEGICFALAAALGIPLGKDDPSVQLGHALRNRGRCLVILDNFEQVVAHAESTLGQWLDHAAEASFMATSRERLHLRGEDLFPLEPLPLEMDAIDLFVARARAQRPDFILSDANRAAVAEVVRLLDGLPLAIELAAARARILSPAQLVERLRDRFSVLAGARGAAARQATLRAAIDWSWDLLAPWEQAAFAQCSVFEGGFTLEAAEAVLDLSSWPEAPSAIDVVQALVDKSLLRTWWPEQRRYELREPYFGMYISIHEYALEKLDAAPHAAKQLALQRHGSYFAAFGTDSAIASLAAGGADQRRMLALDFDNLVAACRRAVVRDDGATAASAYCVVWEVLHLHGPLALAVELGRQVLGCGNRIEAPQRATAMLILASALLRAGRMEETRPLLVQALALAQDAGDRRREARVLNSLASLSRMQGQVPEARESLDRSLSLAREAHDRPFEGVVFSHLGLLHREQGRLAEAREHLNAALVIATETGDRREQGIIVGSLGHLCSEEGKVEAARQHLEAALAITREFADRAVEAVVLANLAHLESEQGRCDEAREHLGAALVIQREIGNRRLESIALGNLGAIDLEQGRMDEARTNLGEALAIAREVGNRRHQSFLLATLGALHFHDGRYGDAQADYEAALAIARDVGDRRGEGIALCGLGALLKVQSRFGEAQLQYEQALALSRAAGYRRIEGSALGHLGDLLARQGSPTDALDTLRAGEALLREVADCEELAKLLCIRGRVLADAGDRGPASAALAEAEALADAMGSAPDTQLGRDIATLREMLA